MDLTNLEIECEGKTCIKVWAKCHNAEDVDDIIAWLRLAKDVMIKWEKIRARNAKVSQPTKAPASKNEGPQPGQIQSESQVTEGADRRLKQAAQDNLQRLSEGGAN